MGVGYGSNLEEVTGLVKEAIAGVKGVQAEPEPVVSFHTFGDSSVNLTAYFWVDTAIAGLPDARDQAVKRVKAALDGAGVDIPYPVTTVLLEKGSA